ncbi:MAG: sulfatase [Halobacteriales archaeon]
MVVIYVDDMGWLDTGFQGSEYYHTPNCDALSRNGLTCTNGYANAPNSSPSRACFMTGQYTPRHGVFTVGSAERGNASARELDPPPNSTELSPDTVTLPEVLSETGYETAFFGKWDLGGANTDRGPRAQGFDLNVGGTAIGRPHQGYFPPYGLPNIDGEDREYLTDRLTDEAVAFIEDAAEPFFLQFSHYSVHTPIQAPDQDVEQYRDRECWNGQCNAVYGGMIEALDRSVGRVMDALDAQGITEDTLVVFTSDNGGLGDYEEVELSSGYSDITSQGPLRGGKGTLYEGGIRVPTVFHWPKRIDSGETSVPVIGSDVFPTLAELGDATVPDDHPVDGRSLVPLLGDGEPPDREALYWHFPAYLQASPSTFRTRPVGAIRAGTWKLLEFFEDDRLELYDLADDLGEENDLSTERPEKRDDLLGMMRSWRNRVNAPMPVPR